MSVVLSCCGIKPIRVLLVDRQPAVLGRRLVEDRRPAAPAVERDVAPPSFTCRKMSGLSGLIHMPWLSPCGVFMVVNVFPPSVDLWNPSSLTNTVFSSFGLTLT